MFIVSAIKMSEQLKCYFPVRIAPGKQSTADPMDFHNALDSNFQPKLSPLPYITGIELGKPAKKIKMVWIGLVELPAHKSHLWGKTRTLPAFY